VINGIKIVRLNKGSGFGSSYGSRDCRCRRSKSQVPLLTKNKIDTPPKATKPGIKPAYQCFNLELDNKMFGKCNQFFRYTKFNLPKVNTN
jgi:hypothetical protein